MLKKPFDEILAIQFVCESNLIEDIDVPQEELKIAIQSRNSKGHTAALLLLEYCLILDIRFSKYILCILQQFIIEEQNLIYNNALVRIPREQTGCYRTCNVRIAGRLGTPPNLIEKEMDSLLQEVRFFEEDVSEDRVFHTEHRIQNILNLISDIHLRYENIHPFIDGNGRTGRLLVWYLMRFVGLTPFIFTSHDKGYTYYNAFRSELAMREYFITRYLNI